jgi:hypothetical protein
MTAWPIRVSARLIRSSDPAGCFCVSQCTDSGISSTRGMNAAVIAAPK